MSLAAPAAGVLSAGVVGLLAALPLGMRVPVYPGGGFRFGREAFAATRAASAACKLAMPWLRLDSC